MGVRCTRFKFGCTQNEFTKYQNVVGIVTHYLRDRIGIKSRCGWDFSHPSRPTLGPTQPPVQRLPVLFSESKAGGVRLWPITSIYRRGWRNNRTIPLLLRWAFMACMYVRMGPHWKPMQPLCSWSGYGPALVDTPLFQFTNTICGTFAPVCYWSCPIG